MNKFIVFTERTDINYRSSFYIESTKSMDDVHDIIFATINNVNRIYKMHCNEIDRDKSNTMFDSITKKLAAARKDARLIKFDVGTVRIYPQTHPSFYINHLDVWLNALDRKCDYPDHMIIDATHGNL